MMTSTSPIARPDRPPGPRSTARLGSGSGSATGRCTARGSDSGLDGGSSTRTSSTRVSPAQGRAGILTRNPSRPHSKRARDRGPGPRYAVAMRLAAGLLVFLLAAGAATWFALQEPSTYGLPVAGAENRDRDANSRNREGAGSPSARRPASHRDPRPGRHLGSRTRRSDGPDSHSGSPIGSDAGATPRAARLRFRLDVRHAVHPSRHHRRPALQLDPRWRRLARRSSRRHPQRHARPRSRGVTGDRAPARGRLQPLAEAESRNEVRVRIEADGYEPSALLPFPRTPDRPTPDRPTPNRSTPDRSTPSPAGERPP